MCNFSPERKERKNLSCRRVEKYWGGIMFKGNYRWVLGWFVFFITFIGYMDRVNLSVATPAIMGDFGFDKVQMGWVQTAFFAGYAAMQIPGGIMAAAFGHRKVVCGAITWWSAFTALTAACSSFTPFIIVRALFGLGEGPLYPALANFNYRWYHKTERARASSFMLAGSFVGPIVGPPVTVALMGAWGWQSVFVLFGVLGIAIAAMWWIFTKERPEDCKYMSKEELAWINQSAEPQSNTAKEKAPWGKFFKSRQFWALGLQYFVTDYVMFVYLAWLPLYLMEAQGFSLKSMGIAAAMPWLALCLMTFATGGISDRMLKTGVSKNIARTMFGVIGLAICCVTLYLGAISTDQFMTVVWLTISLGSLGFLFTTSWAVCADIGGKHVGAISGWMNFCGNIGGVIAPIATAVIATTYGWQAAILVTAATTVVGIIAWFLVTPDKPICE